MSEQNDEIANRCVEIIVRETGRLDGPDCREVMEGIRDQLQERVEAIDHDARAERKWKAKRGDTTP